MKIDIYNVLKNKIEQVDTVQKTDEEWKGILTPEQYRVTRLSHTERPFSVACQRPERSEKGIYRCVCCGMDLFRYEDKFESGTGWPSFWQPVSELNIKTRPDKRGGMERTELLCARCLAHLGHVFVESSRPGGKRYCINSTALKFFEMEK